MPNDNQNQNITGGNQPDTNQVVSPNSNTVPPPQISEEAKKYSLVTKLWQKKLPTLLGILILAGGIATGLILLRQPQDIREKAQSVSCDYNNGTNWRCCTDSPGKWQFCLADGQWGPCEQCQGCSCGTSSPAPSSTAKCNTIEAYKVTGEPISASTTWTKLTGTDLTKLKGGDIIYFLVKATYISGSGTIDAAKIKVNNSEEDGSIKPATTLCPTMVGAECTVEFYRKYTVPTGVTTFSSSVKLHHTLNNIWF